MKYTTGLILFLLPAVLLAGNPRKDHSILASGTWYRIAVTQTGLYRITWEDLVSMGLDPSQVNPANIRVYGNGAGMLPELNSKARIDDLRENSIAVIGGDDGTFDPQDYVVFYGEAPDQWIYDDVRKIFNHIKNLYSDTTFYYVNTDLGPGNRVSAEESTDSLPSYTSRRFLDYAFHELDSLSLIKSGKLWFGEVFDDNRNSYDFSFSFPNADTLSAVYITTAVAAKAPVKSKFYLSDAEGLLDTLEVDLTDPGSLSVYAREKKRNTLLFFPGDTVKLNLMYELPTPTSIGWLNYLELNCQRFLTFNGPQMPFRDPNNIAPGKVTEFILKKVNPSVKIWDVTRKNEIREILPNSFDSVIRFRLPTDTLREFIAFDGSFFLPVTLAGPVANQDLHGIGSSVLLIVTHPIFEAEAGQLAEFHRTHNNLTVGVVTTLQVFNEFSSGMHDPTAIRDFAKLLYDKDSTANRLRYLLLFGDGSYDPKDRVPDNKNMVPTFQSAGSLNTLASYVTDDYFGILGDSEGSESNGSIEVGVGRFPVSTPEDAGIMVEKILHYADTTYPNQSDWRNVFTFVADDENSNLHLHHAESLANIVQSKYPAYNVRKIYLDAYPMVSTPAGMRLPDVNVALNNAVERGTLIVNYNGHGGEDGWAAEKVLTIQDITGWKNKDKLPVFITATCEFSRFDNPERLTAGEMVLLHPQGGAIALYSTTRAAFASTNIRLDTSFFRNLIDTSGGPNPKMGDLIRISKNNNNNNPNMRNFALLGDPAQSIAFPEFRIRTTGINQNDLSQGPDTVLGMSLVTVKGRVEDNQGNRLDNFNGILYPKVFDKFVTYVTIGNTSGSYPESFQMQDKLLSDGKATVEGGEFSFSFMMPQSVSLNFGKGKISYYARNGTMDANGYSNQIVIGGENPDVDPVNEGPEIRLYMDHTGFVSGDVTGKNPLLLAFLNDTNGINFINLGIGHEILAVLDGQTSYPVILNDYYEPDLDNYGSGSIRFPFENLSIGRHTLRLKAWDLFNNSSEEEIDFFVFEHPQLSLQQVFNAPNPFREGTTFYYQPVPGGGKMDILIQVYTTMGQLVKTIETSQVPGIEYNYLGSIYWDGTNDNGRMLSSGLYVYRFMVRASSGAVSETSQKLVIQR
jgi:hypothetical protein